MSPPLLRHGGPGIEVGRQRGFDLAPAAPARLMKRLGALGKLVRKDGVVELAPHEREL